MKKLWYRVVLWHNNFCPTHGQQSFFVRGWWCPMCYSLKSRLAELVRKSEVVLGRKWTV